MPEIDNNDSVSSVNGNTLFGKYELGKLLGCGAFAKVYHARDTRSGQSVAIKIVNKKKISTNPSLVTNIKREISIMRCLNHPNIVKLFEVMATRSKIYFVMEFVKGGELFNRIAKQGRCSEDVGRKYFQQLISAVSYCHARGVYHRDLKPENLLLDENGDLKISDFGLSALKDQTRPDGLLHTLCGTPAYVAPEILGKKGYDGAKVDVWSCGVVLFVLMAGYLPFNDPNLMAMYKKIYKGEYRCPKWMSADLKRFLSRLLDSNPATRITIDGILKDPWFVKGFKDIKFYDDEDDADKFVNFSGEEPKSISNLNAFDLISFSSGLDLSGFFLDASNIVENGDRFVSMESPEKLVEKIENFAKCEKLRVKKKKEWGIELVGESGKFKIAVEVYRLTESLVVLEAKKKGGDSGCYRNKLMHQLMSVPVPETPVVAGN